MRRRGEEDDRRVAGPVVRLKPLEHLVAAELREREVEHDELRSHRDGALDRAHPIVDELAREAVLGETLAESRAGDGIVVDDEDRGPFRHGHRWSANASTANR